MKSSLKLHGRLCHILESPFLKAPLELIALDGTLMFAVQSHT